MTIKGISVLLVYTNSPMDNLIPIGISILSACLKQSGHNVRLFDTTFYKTQEETGDDVRVRTLQVKYTNLSKVGLAFKDSDIFEDFRKVIDVYKPQLIGVSCVETTLNTALSLLNSIADKKVIKLIGGIGVMFNEEYCINNSNVDIACVGEGEGAIVDIANAIRDCRQFSHIKNLLIRQGNSIIRNKLRPLVDINSLPYQDWSIFEKPRFYKPMGGKIRITGAFEFARGCPRMCSFCCNYGINKFYKGKYFRKKAIHRIVDEINYAREQYSLEYIYFYAENFLLTMGEDDFVNFIEQYRKIALPYWIETEPKSLTEERLFEMKKVGCEGISVGIEHGNERFRRTILNRHTSNEQLMNSFQVAKQSGIRISANNIIGFPHETRELIFDTILLNRALKADNVIVNLFNPYHGTKLRRVAIRDGLLIDNTNGEDYRTTTVLNQPQLKREELLGLHRTFVLYVKMPQSKWHLIKKAEKFDDTGNKIFQQLTQEYRDSFLT